MGKVRQFLSRYFFNWINLSTVVIIFGFMWLINSGLKFEFFDVFGEVLKDYQLTDSYYTKHRVNQAGENSAEFEDQILLVNIGKNGRPEITRMIEILNKYEPLAIGIDATFFTNRSYSTDSAFGQAIAKVKNFVIAATASGNQDPKTGVWDTLLRPQPIIAGKAHLALVNTGMHSSANNNFLTWRDFSPLTLVRSDDKKKIDTLEFLGVKLASFYSPENVKKFYARKNAKEDIYFTGNVIYGNNKFFVLDWDQVLLDTAAFDPKSVKGKLVLLGYLGESYLSYFEATRTGESSEFAFDEDKFYTPMNKKSLGRGEPDMYGVVVHANIASMIIREKFIDQMPSWLSWLIAICICYLNVSIFAYIINSPTLGIWYNALSKAIQLVELVAIVLLTTFLFNEFLYKVELSVALFVIALSGDVTEIYIDLVVNSLRRTFKRLR